MRTSQFVAAMALSASAAEAAPRGSMFRQWYEKTIAGRLNLENQNVVEHEPREAAGQLRHAFQRRMAQNGTGNATTVTLTTTMTQRETTTLDKLAGQTAAAAVAPLPIDVCPTGNLVISTTTIDVTVYASATEAATVGALPVENKAKAAVQDTVTLGLPSSSTTAQAAANGVAPIQSSSSVPVLSSTSAATSTTTPVSTNQGPVINAAPILNPFPSSGTTAPTVVVPTPNTTPPASPSSTQTPILIPTPAITSSPSSSSSSTSARLQTPHPIATIPIQVVIDHNMRPVTTSALPSTPSAPAPAAPTKTLCEHDTMAGPPEKRTQYCGVTGRPAGVYFLAEFIEERSNVPVTEEGCFQFCGSVMESTKGCQSYRFYHNQLGAPRCALYGMPVSWSVEDLDASVGDKWFDLGCGSPSVEAWHSTSAGTQPAAATSS